MKRKVLYKDDKIIWFFRKKRTGKIVPAEEGQGFSRKEAVDVLRRLKSGEYHLPPYHINPPGDHYFPCIIEYVETKLWSAQLGADAENIRQQLKKPFASHETWWHAIVGELLDDRDAMDVLVEKLVAASEELSEMLQTSEFVYNNVYDTFDVALKNIVASCLKEN